MAEKPGALESLVMFAHAFRDKTVWLSGHTGFKGSWLAHWLLELGARVHGFALAPPTTPALFDQLGLSHRLHHQIADLRDRAAVQKSLRDAQPDFVFHLAAQPLVRVSYEEPVETYATNLMGTLHVMEALRTLKKPCAAVLVTTDKCYENREWIYGYREEDPLGGYDPYSSSKAAAEIAISAWRRSFFGKHSVRLASARAGNVIGGGDYALDRLVPDCIRALAEGRSIPVRNPHALRSWQHVLECLSGYLWLAAQLAQPSPAIASLASAFNFGPNASARQTVRQLVEEILRCWPGQWQDLSDAHAPHEATLLALSIDKAGALLDWHPCWDFKDAVRYTIEWYRQCHTARSADLAALTSRQIADYVRAARQRSLAWAQPE